MAVEELSERELRVLEHLQKAQELEVTIAEYARSFEVDASELYSVRQTLIRKGAMAGRGRAVEEAQLGEFVSVQVIPMSPEPPPAPMCRICHPSGLVIECTSFPPASWLVALLPGARDVPA